MRLKEQDKKPATKKISDWRNNGKFMNRAGLPPVEPVVKLTTPCELKLS